MLPIQETIHTRSRFQADIQALGKTLRELKCLSNKYHQRILGFLTGKELSVGQLVTLMDLSQSEVSLYLTDLRKIGMVEVRASGKFRYYKVTPKLETLIDAIDNLIPSHDRENG